MAAVIKTRIISAVQENAIQLSNGQFGRLVTLPPAWNMIRVGMRLHMTDSGANLAGTPKWYMGIGRGVTNMIGSATCDHFLGLKGINPLWTRNATYYTLSSNNCSAVKKVNVTETTSPASAGQSYIIGNQAAAAAADRTVWFCTITKGSPNYTIQAFQCNNPTVGDASSSQFLAQMIAVSPVLTNHIQPGSTTLAVDEGVDGVFNAVQVYWDRIDALIEICDLAVAVLS